MDTQSNNRKSHNIKIERRLMVYHGRRGPNRVFGSDVDERQSFTDEQAIRRFEMTWERGLRAAVEASAVCDPERAKARLDGTSRKGSPRALEFFDPRMEHREFKMKDLEFLAQLEAGADGCLILNQLWYIPSIDDNPKLLRVMFDTAREREYFRQLALKLGWNDEDLGKWLVQEFIEKLKKAYPIDEIVAEKGENSSAMAVKKP